MEEEDDRRDGMIVFEIESEASARAPDLPPVTGTFDEDRWTEYLRHRDAWLSSELARALEDLPDVSIQLDRYLVKGGGLPGSLNPSRNTPLRGTDNQAGLADIMGGGSSGSKYRLGSSFNLRDFLSGLASKTDSSSPSSGVPRGSRGSQPEPQTPSRSGSREIVGVHTGSDGSVVSTSVERGEDKLTITQTRARPSGAVEEVVHVSDDGHETHIYTIRARDGRWARERETRNLETDELTVDVDGDTELFEDPDAGKDPPPKEKPPETTKNPDPTEPPELPADLRPIVEAILRAIHGEPDFSLVLPDRVDPGPEGATPKPEGMRLVIDRESLVRLLDGSEPARGIPPERLPPLRKPGPGGKPPPPNET